MTLEERVIVEIYTGYCMTSGDERNAVYKNFLADRFILTNWLRNLL